MTDGGICQRLFSNYFPSGFFPNPSQRYLKFSEPLRGVFSGSLVELAGG
jgi:hypothetical protein